MQKFEGKLAVVTGGGTGMGRELCRQLAAEDAMWRCATSPKKRWPARRGCAKPSRPRAPGSRRALPTSPTRPRSWRFRRPSRPRSPLCRRVVPMGVQGAQLNPRVVGLPWIIGVAIHQDFGG